MAAAMDIIGSVLGSHSANQYVDEDVHVPERHETAHPPHFIAELVYEKVVTDLLKLPGVEMTPEELLNGIEPYTTIKFTNAEEMLFYKLLREKLIFRLSSGNCDEPAFAEAEFETMRGERTDETDFYRAFNSMRVWLQDQPIQTYFFILAQCVQVSAPVSARVIAEYLLKRGIIDLDENCVRVRAATKRRPEYEAEVDYEDGGVPDEDDESAAAAGFTPCDAGYWEPSPSAAASFGDGGRDAMQGCEAAGAVFADEHEVRTFRQAKWKRIA